MTAISERLDNMTKESGYLVGYNPFGRDKKSLRDPWSKPNAKPFALYRIHEGERPGETRVFAFIASFATAEALERNWRGRIAA